MRGRVRDEREGVREGGIMGGREGYQIPTR